jgi:hypothetical protein
MSRLLLILVLALQPLTVLGAGAMVDAAQTCIAALRTDASPMTGGCCAMMTGASGCPMHPDACDCMEAPARPARPTPAPAPVRHVDATGVALLPTAECSVPELTQANVSPRRQTGQPMLPVAHNRALSLLGVWRT